LVTQRVCLKLNDKQGKVVLDIVHVKRSMFLSITKPHVVLR